jgi:predicted glycosyltransferase
MNKTGRTKGICIKVRPQTYNLIQKQKGFGINISEWFEIRFQEEFSNSIEKLEDQKKRYTELTKELDLKLKELKKEQVSLTEEELRWLVIACDPKFNQEKQYNFFKQNYKKKLTYTGFLKLKQKYIDKIFG